MSALMERPIVALDSAAGRYIEQVTSVDSFVDRLMTIHHGSHHGYYEALADCGPLTYVDLASQSGISETAAWEWLEDQVALGVLVADDRLVPAWERRYRLPAYRAALLLNLEDPFFNQSASDAIAA